MDDHDQEREWRRQELAIQAAQLGERVRQLETMFRESELRILERSAERQQRSDKALVDLEERTTATLLRAVTALTTAVEERVTLQEFRPYKLISWVLGGAVLIAAVPTLAQTLIPTLIKLIFR